jgi:actin
MINNVILSGGTTMMPGFAARTKKSLAHLLDADFNHNTVPQVIAEGNRYISTWIGASMVASMSSFDKVFIRKEEYHENGEDRLTLFSKIF